MNKKRVIILTILIVFLLLGLLLSVRFIPKRENPIKERLNSLDSEKITGCMIRWYEWDETYRDEIYYEYTETNPEKVQQFFEAFCHMKMNLKEGSCGMGVHYYGIYFVQEDEVYPVCSYCPSNHLLAPGEKIYGGEFTNIKELDRKYDFSNLFDEMIENGKKAESY